LSPADPVSAFRARQPEVFFLAAGELAPLENILRRLGVLVGTETVRQAEPAGVGNMNCTLRITTSARSLIVKQARPWVEKYPQFAAPADRAVRELEFYQRVAPFPNLAARMPRLLAADRACHLLVLEDLGLGGDYTSAYRGTTWELGELRSLGTFLAELHASFRSTIPDEASANRAMRALNHTHIFQIPFQATNGLNLDAICPGLADAAGFILGDSALATRVAELGQSCYLTDGPCLLHGDFFPGSLIRTAAGPRVIDPEFAFFGRAEFDVGVFLAHLVLARQSPVFRSTWLSAYGSGTDLDLGLTLQLAGVEIIRRLLGYAQLPLAASLAERRRMLEIAREWVLRPDPAALGKT
jgi:5-methylthioribose kinase